MLKPNPADRWFWCPGRGLVNAAVCLWCKDKCPRLKRKGGKR